MNGTLRQMLTCHWSARRIQRYLDSDRAAPLTPGEVARLQAHLATCEKCSEILTEHRALHHALSVWCGRPGVDPAAVDRLRDFIDNLAHGGQA